MKDLAIRAGEEHVDLCDALKIMGLAENGATAKHIISTGVVKVDNKIETRKRCKIRAGQIIFYNNQQIRVTQG